MFLKCWCVGKPSIALNLPPLLAIDCFTDFFFYWRSLKKKSLYVYKLTSWWYWDWPSLSTKVWHLLFWWWVSVIMWLNMEITKGKRKRSAKQTTVICSVTCLTSVLNFDSEFLKWDLKGFNDIAWSSLVNRFVINICYGDIM